MKRLYFTGADTVKRGASPITLTSSLSSSQLKESNSSFSIKASNNFSEDAKESYTLDRVKTNGIGVKNVLFAPGVEKSSSSSNLNHSNSMTPITSTSQLIKQTLSPLVHHRPIQQTTTNVLSDSKSASSPLKMKPNSVSMSYGSYQLSTSSSSNTFSMGNNTGNGSKSNFSLSAQVNDSTSNVSPSQRTSSPSRSLSSHTNTNTLPSHVGRSNNIQYQFESNYSLKNKPKNFTSPGNTTFFNALSSITSSSSNVTSANQTSTGTNIISSIGNSNISNSSNIYGTLPKSAATSNSFGGSAANNSSGMSYGSVSAVANEFEQLIARNANSNNSIGGMTSNSSTNSHGNYNTLGSYRVQYSSTNPFLNHFGESSTTDDK